MVIKGIPLYIWEKSPIEMWHEIQMHVLDVEKWSLLIRSIPIEIIWDFSILETDKYTSLCYNGVALESIFKDKLSFIS